jgi:hypothetical protein
LKKLAALLEKTYSFTVHTGRSFSEALILESETKETIELQRFIILTINE